MTLTRRLPSLESAVDRSEGDWLVIAPDGDGPTIAEFESVTRELVGRRVATRIVVWAGAVEATLVEASCKGSQRPVAAGLRTDFTPLAHCANVSLVKPVVRLALPDRDPRLQR
jgi:hypothetical protein